MVVPIKQYKCPNCKHEIQIDRADFIKGIAVVSCTYCGRDSFAVEENVFSKTALATA